LTGERERVPSLHLGRFEEVAVFQTDRHQQDLYLDNMETITIREGARRGSPEQNPADSSAYSGLRGQLRLEQRLLRSRDGNGLQ